MIADRARDTRPDADAPGAGGHQGAVGWRSSTSPIQRRLPGGPPGGPSRPAGQDGPDSAQLLNLLFEFRAAEQRLRAMTRGSTRVGESDLVALRYLLEAQAIGQVLRQKDLAELLGISTASVSGLIDRLSRGGYLHRIPHPDDRRSVAIEPTEATEGEVRAGQQQAHARMLQAMEALTPDERRAVAKFLAALIDSFDHPRAD